MPTTVNVQYISSCSECTINQFMKCKFDNNFSVLTLSGNPSEKELINAFENIQNEYIDLCGIHVPEIELLKSIKALECRIQSMHLYLKVSKDACDQLVEPFIFEVLNDAIPCINNNGYRLTWTNKEDFKKQLNKIELKEKRYIAEHDRKNKELELYRENHPNNIESNSRTEFIRLLNELQKIGYKIDREKTFMEELGIMVNDYNQLRPKSIDLN